MSGLLIYPFCDEFAEFIRCQDALEEYDRLIPVAPKSFGLDGEDASICDGGDPLNINISSDFEVGIEQADAVFLGYVEKNISKQNYMEKIHIALNRKKKVYITKELREHLGDFDGIQYTEVLEYGKEKTQEELTENLLPIPVPVIMVFGIGNYCNKFGIQLKLREYFQRRGYRVLGFGTKSYSKLFAVEALPQFLFENMNNEIKIRKFNAYIYRRVKREKPDVVVIGIPGGIMQINPFKFREFGESAFIISNAVKADLSVLSMYKQDFNHEFIEKLINLCNYKYNFPVRYINIANTNLNISSEDKREYYTTVLSQHIVENVLKELHYEDVFFFNALNEDSMKEACEKICKELEDNI